MARLKRIQQRLDNWAIWLSRGSSGGLGYATRSILVSEVWSRGSYNGMPIPVFDDEAMQTHRAVQALQLTKSHLYITLECIYLKDLGVKATAQRMRRAESTIKSHLEQADHAIAAWLDEQVQEKERKRAQALASGTQGESL